MRCDAIDARDRYYGSMIGVRHGEPLRSAEHAWASSIRSRTSASNPFGDAHAFEARAHERER